MLLDSTTILICAGSSTSFIGGSWGSSRMELPITIQCSVGSSWRYDIYPHILFPISINIVRWFGFNSAAF